MPRKTDERIKHDVESGLAWDTRTWDQKVRVDFVNGVVTLNGTVSSYAQKVAAQAVAHRVAGVLDVANELFVKQKRPYDDVQIAHTVRQALEWAALIPNEKIMSTVTDGWVKLEGKVSSLTERSEAEWAIENLIGVAGVINELEVEPIKTDAATLRKSIETALELRADKEAEGLRVEIEDGEVTLSGRVHSWPERKAVVASISHARGVRKINDKLRIDPYF